MDSYDKQTDILKALAHPARLQILDALRAGPECVCHLEALLGLRQAYVSQQLARLRESGLVIDHKEGLNVFYEVKDPEVFELIDQIRNVAQVPSESLLPRVAEHQAVAGCVCPKCQPVEAMVVR